MVQTIGTGSISMDEITAKKQAELEAQLEHVRRGASKKSISDHAKSKYHKNNL